VAAAATPVEATGEMPSFAAPTGLPDESVSQSQAWAGGDPAQVEQMRAMQEQMAAMQAQLQQQALQQPAAPSISPTPSGAATPGPTAPLSGYRRPESTPAPATQPTAAPSGGPAPATPDLPAATRPSVEGSPYEAVLADEQPASPFGAESSPFARLEAEQASAEAASTAQAAADHEAGAFRQEPQRLISADQPTAPEPQEEEPGEVDRVMLAKEFSGLLQVGQDGDEE